MKKIFLLFLILFFGAQICLADETVNVDEDIDTAIAEDTQQSEPLEGYLEYTEPEPDNTVYLEDAVFKNSLNIKSPQKVNSKAVVKNAKQFPSFEPGKFELASKFSTQEYRINPLSTGYTSKVGNFSFGTSYDASINTAQSSYSTSVFTKYEWKHFALKTALSKSTNDSLSAFNDKLFVIPELKLTKRLSLLDIMQTDAMQINKNNKVVLRYTPNFKKYADEVQLELGAGQSFYNNDFIKSSVEFSTRFKL